MQSVFGLQSESPTDSSYIISAVKQYVPDIEKLIKKVIIQSFQIMDLNYFSILDQENHKEGRFQPRQSL